MQHTSFLTLRKLKIAWLSNFYRETRERKFTRSERIWLERTLEHFAFAIGCGVTSAGNSKIYINESLTNYRKTFFGRIKEYKKAEEQSEIFMDHNSKIILKVNETYATEAFTTHKESEDYQQRAN